MALEFGLDTFGDIMADADGQLISYAQTLRNLVAEGVLADAVGIDFIGIGEHHRREFAASSPEITAAAIASKTERIHIGTAVTVLSSDDPIRVFQRFSTLDAISRGRAEVILGRGSFTESFPLFGYDLSRYNELFEEKLELFAKVRQQQPVTWSGTTRTPLRDQVVYPPLEHGLLPTWVGVGGSPESVVRAARYGFRLMLAVIGGPPARFRPYIELFRRSLADFGRAMQPVGLHSLGHIAETDAQAQEEYWPHFAETANRIGKERGFREMTRELFDREVVDGALFIGSPETVAQKIARTARTLDISRFDLKYGNVGLRQEQVTRTIELYGTEVIPRVRELLGEYERSSEVEALSHRN